MSGGPRQQLTGAEHAVIGSLAGIVEVCIQQPTVAVKNALQEGRPISWKPSHLYRGLLVTCASIAPITAIQFSVNGVLGNYLLNARLTSGEAGKAHLADSEKLLIAGTAGGVSALVGSPAELIMIQQQRSSYSLLGAMNVVIREKGPVGIYRGFLPTFTREAVWSASYLALGGLFKRRLHEMYPSVFGEERRATASQAASASLIGSIGAGLLAVVVTQPVDTVKTVMQGSALEERPPSLLATVKQIAQKSSWRGLYKGMLPRSLRLIGATFILSNAREVLERKAIDLKLSR